VADYGLKISREGVDVNTAADKDLILKSSINMLKVAAQGASTVANGGVFTLAHGLGYLPNYFFLAENTPGSGVYYWVTANRSELNMLPYADSTNIYLKAKGTPTGTYNLYYYVFIDPM
jgi:hypothetical protein